METRYFACKTRREIRRNNRRIALKLATGYIGGALIVAGALLGAGDIVDYAGTMILAGIIVSLFNL